MGFKPGGDEYGKRLHGANACYATSLLSELTLLSTAASSLLQCVLPVVQLHAKGTAQGGGGFGVGDLHHVNMAVGGAEVAAVEGGHLGLGLLKSGPCSVLQYPSKLIKTDMHQQLQG